MASVHAQYCILDFDTKPTSYTCAALYDASNNRGHPRNGDDDSMVIFNHY